MLSRSPPTKSRRSGCVRLCGRTRGGGRIGQHDRPARATPRARPVPVGPPKLPLTPRPGSDASTTRVVPAASSSWTNSLEAAASRSTGPTSTSPIKRRAPSRGSFRLAPLSAPPAGQFDGLGWCVRRLYFSSDLQKSTAASCCSSLLASGGIWRYQHGTARRPAELSGPAQAGVRSTARASTLRCMRSPQGDHGLFQCT